MQLQEKEENIYKRHTGKLSKKVPNTTGPFDPELTVI